MRAEQFIDPRRILRAGPPARRIEWRVSLRTKGRFYALLAELVDLEQEPLTPELWNRVETLRDEIRALPGYPKRYHPENDLIVPVTTSEQV